MSRENFYKLKQRLAETRMLAAGLARPEDTYASPDEQGFGVMIVAYALVNSPMNITHLSNITTESLIYNT